MEKRAVQRSGPCPDRHPQIRRHVELLLRGLAQVCCSVTRGAPPPLSSENSLLCHAHLSTGRRIQNAAHTQKTYLKCLDPPTRTLSFGSVHSYGGRRPHYYLLRCHCVKPYVPGFCG